MSSLHLNSVISNIGACPHLAPYRLCCTDMAILKWPTTW